MVIWHPSFLLIVYWGFWQFGDTTLRQISVFIPYHFISVLLTALLLKSLLNSSAYKQKAEDLNDEMAYMLRMQPSYTFKVRKENGVYRYALLEGQMFQQLGLERRMKVGQSIEEAAEAGVFSSEQVKLLTESYEMAWTGEKVRYEFSLYDYQFLVRLKSDLG